MLDKQQRLVCSTQCGPANVPHGDFGRPTWFLLGGLGPLLLSQQKCPFLLLLLQILVFPILEFPWRDIFENFVAWHQEFGCWQIGETDVVVDQPAGSWGHILVRGKHELIDNVGRRVAGRR